MQEDLECSLRLFADDALLYHKVSQESDTLALQRDLCKLGPWADKWQMVFNPSKCYQMTVHRTRSPDHKNNTLYHQSLKAVQQHSFLGILLSHDLRWNQHVAKIVKKANSSLGFVKRNLYSCSERTKRAAYITLVRPHLEYASAVWDPYQHNQVDQIEAVQNRAARFIKSNYEFTSSVSQMKHDERRNSIIGCTYSTKQLTETLPCLYPATTCIQHGQPEIPHHHHTFSTDGTPRLLRSKFFSQNHQTMELNFAPNSRTRLPILLLRIPLV